MDRRGPATTVLTVPTDRMLIIMNNFATSTFKEVIILLLKRWWWKKEKNQGGIKINIAFSGSVEMAKLFSAIKADILLTLFLLRKFYGVLFLEDKK